MNRKIIGGMSALTVVAAGTGLYLAGPALAGDSPDAPTVAATSQSPRQGPVNRRLRPRFRQRVRGVHGQATVRTRNGFREVVWQRGQLTAKDGGTLTVRSLDGTTWQWETDGNTKVRKDARRSDLGALMTGEFVLVAGTETGGRTARHVVVPRNVPQRATETPTPSPS